MALEISMIFQPVALTIDHSVAMRVLAGTPAAAGKGWGEGGRGRAGQASAAAGAGGGSALAAVDRPTDLSA